MEKKLRLRAPNFTTSDNLLLCDIISKYKLAIESKKTDGASLSRKQKAWQEVSRQFNSETSGYTRTTESLQQNYKNLKKKARKIVAGTKVNIPIEKAPKEESCIDMLAELYKIIDSKEKKIKKSLMHTVSEQPAKCEEDPDPPVDKIDILVTPSIDMYTSYDEDSSVMSSENNLPVESKTIDTADISSHDEEDWKMQEETEPATNNKPVLKRRGRPPMLTCKKASDLQNPVKQTESYINMLTPENMEVAELQKELVKIQLLQEREKLEHSRVLRAMEIKDMKEKHEHHKIIRKIEIERLMMSNK